MTDTTRITAILKALALATVPVVGAFFCVLLFQIGGAVDALKTQGLGTLKNANTTLVGLNQALATVNASKSGTLSMLDDTIFQARLTVDSVNKVAIHEQAQLGTLDADVALLVGQTSETLGSVRKTANQTTASLADLTHRASGTMNAATETIQATQPLLGRSALFFTRADDFMATLPPISANVQEITAQGAIIAKDAKVEEQKYVYPPKTPWYKKIVPTVLRSAELAYDFIR